MRKDDDIKLTPKQDMFCREYLVDLNATQAAIRAGYSMQKPQDGMYYVYFLMHPITKKIFYIGKGIRNRMTSHERRVRRGIVDNPSKCREIFEIVSNGLSVQTECFAVYASEKEAYGVESWLIKAFEGTGITNISRGTTTADDRTRGAAKIMLSRFRSKSEYLLIFETRLPEILKRSVINVFGSAGLAYDKVYGTVMEMASL